MSEVLVFRLTRVGGGHVVGEVLVFKLTVLGEL